MGRCGLCPCPILNFIVVVADEEDKRALESLAATLWCLF